MTYKDILKIAPTIQAESLVANLTKKKKKKENILEDGLKIGLGFVGLGIGLHALHDLTD